MNKTSCFVLKGMLSYHRGDYLKENKTTCFVPVKVSEAFAKRFTLPNKLILKYIE